MKATAPEQAISELIKGYPVITEIPVAWGDMDSWRHVNNVIYFRYFESARIVYFDRVVETRHQLDPTAEPDFGRILGSASCKFKFPLTYPDTVIAAIRVTDISDDRFTMQCRLVSQRHQRVAAECEGVMVSYDYNKLQKVILPELTRRAIRTIEESAVPGM